MKMKESFLGKLTSSIKQVAEKPMIRQEFVVKAPLEKTWALLNDMERFGLCIPGCKKVKKISETEVDWVIEAKVLRTSRTIVARTHAVEISPPVHASFQGEGELHERFNRYKMIVSGTTDLEPVSENETKLVFAGSVSASGAAGFLINKVASGQMKELFQDFEKNIKAALEK